MPSSPSKTSKTQAAPPQVPSLGGHILNVFPDAPDLRDRIYEPALVELALSMPPAGPDMSPIQNQGQEGACTGFALSSAITLLNKIRHQRLSPPVDVPIASPRMLYEMAKINDEWPGEDYEGSSIRGALKGFSHNGACSLQAAPYVAGEPDWHLTVHQAKDARKTGLGAYYRLRPELTDYHAALNETGVIIVSARVHRGWQNPPRGDIKPSHISEGGHAFIIVGYDQTGFLIQNSWGEDWGRFDGHPGIARWRYEDWAATVMDAWVLRLSVPTPDAFDMSVGSDPQGGEFLFAPETRRAPRHEDIIGHVIHLNDGQLVTRGKYPTPLSTIQETADFLADESATAKRGYKHLMLMAHGGLNGQAASANRVRRLKEVFKRNGIYPIHFMWETGFLETLKDVIFNSKSKAQARVGGVGDFWDRALESFARGPGTALWRDMKWDAEESFKASGGGRAALKLLLDGNAKRNTPLKVHLVGSSAGAIFLGHLLDAMANINPSQTPAQSCSLMAPACTVDFFTAKYQPRIGQTNTRDGLKTLVQYNLIDQRERDDTTGPYRKSLLYFVSNAFEDRRKMPLLGMEKFCDGLPSHSAHDLHYAGRARKITDSHSHGGFDNDRKTMNHILETILGAKPSTAKGFQEEDM